jgi:hypothetical protein
MKTTTVFFSFVLATLSVSLFNACDEGDTEKPVINLIEPEEGAQLAIGNDHGVHFEMKLSDNDALNSYRVEIHNNFDGHEHAALRSDEPDPFFYDSTFTDVHGKKNADIHHHAIRIPVGVAEGDYHLVVYCLDLSGNEAHIARNVILTNDAVEEDHDEDDHED